MKSLVSYGVFILAVFTALTLPSKLESANLTSVKDTLSTSRLSYHGRVNSTGTTVGSSHVLIQTSTGLDSASEQANSISTANLKAQDTVTIGANSYTIVGIIDSDEFTVSPVLISGDTDNNDPIYLNVKPVHTVTFTTATAVANGFFQILLPADSDASTSYDGKADDQGYDMTTSGVTVTGTDVGSTYDFVTGVSTRSGDTGCTSPSNYHCLEVHYSGTGAVGQAITITLGSGASTPIAPATGTAHTEGTADTYPVIIKNFAASANPNSATAVDATTGRVAHIESVRVTATVDPTINFSVAGISSGATRCGVSTSVTTTATAVPFGTMVLNTFKTLAHDLTVSTNASGGYAVTAAENDQLGKDGGTTPNIQDTLCDSGTCSESSPSEWNTATNNGFGYSLENFDAASVAFEYNNSGNTFRSKQFADLQAAETPQTLFSSTTVANAENVFVCYRLSVGATQAAGDYENQITYTATGTF